MVFLLLLVFCLKRSSTQSPVSVGDEGHNNTSTTQHRSKQHAVARLCGGGQGHCKSEHYMRGVCVEGWKISLPVSQTHTHTAPGQVSRYGGAAQTKAGKKQTAV